MNLKLLQKVQLIELKSQHSFPIDMFYQKGNGMKTILNRTGRLMDFKGIYVVFNTDDEQSLVFESEAVLHDIQKLVRGMHLTDLRMFANWVSQLETNDKVILEMLRSKSVVWLEVANDIERANLYKLMTRCEA